jgi:hypothetical protein
MDNIESLIQKQKAEAEKLRRKYQRMYASNAQNTDRQPNMRTRNSRKV